MKISLFAWLRNLFKRYRSWISCPNPSSYLHGLKCKTDDGVRVETCNCGGNHGDVEDVRGLSSLVEALEGVEEHLLINSGLLKHRSVSTRGSWCLVVVGAE